MYRNCHPIRIVYETKASPAAVQWLAANQTHGQKHPLAFSQSQAIQARSLLPCQDSCSVKYAFEWRFACKNPLVPVCSGEQVEGSGGCVDGVGHINLYIRKWLRNAD
jgi:leukotriene-A4 hydrolase